MFPYCLIKSSKAGFFHTVLFTQKLGMYLTLEKCFINTIHYRRDQHIFVIGLLVSLLKWQ